MSWFGSSDPVADLDAKIEEATSESIPNGELDVAIALEITDEIRSKKVQPKQAMRCLKKRLTKIYTNPNLLASTLKLCDMCVKNGGSHFLVEINSKEFIDYLVEVIFKVHYDTKNYRVYSHTAKMKAGEQILTLVQEWAAYFEKSGKASYLDRVLTNLRTQGYEFPPLDPLISSVAANFVDSQAPPDWIDGKECMICYTPFSVMNRKHHCRACGGVFCQTHSANNIPLVSLGILLPVRVCDDCNQIHKGSGSKQPSHPRSRAALPNTHPGTGGEDDDDELKRAIELSLQESLVPQSFARPAVPPPVVQSSNGDEDLDEDLKAAIKASLEDYQDADSSPFKDPPEAAEASREPIPNLYLNLMPFDANAYSNSQDQPSYNSSTYDRQPSQSNEYNAAQFSPHTQQSITRQVAPPKPEKLTEQDEENINLFVQLMNGIKNDRFKQANILNDQNLNDLHGKVVRLKPKLNRSLRDSIDKYEYFLEMNNKISTITRLYDQFLENMLNNAYSRHSIAQPSNYYSPYPPTSDPELQQPEHTGGMNRDYRRENQYQSTYFQSPQETGQQTQHWNQQHLQRQQLHQDSSERFVGQQELYPNGSGQFIEQNSEESVPNGKPLPSIEKHNTAPYSVSELNPSDIKIADSGRQRSDSMYPVNSEMYPKLPSPTYGLPESNNIPTNYTGSYPQEPSSPPDEDSDVDETESVSSRFPPLENQYEADEPTEPAAREHASMRFPSLNRIEQVQSATETSGVPLAPKQRAEPEPLIEL